MPKSKHRKSHQSKLNDYKARAKREQDSFKKKMIEHYTQMQQQAIANQEAHSSTEEVSGPDINIDELNIVDELNPVIDVESTVVDVVDVKN